MTTHIHTVAFQGIEVLPIDVQAQAAAGLPAFTMVGPIAACLILMALIGGAKETVAADSLNLPTVLIGMPDSFLHGGESLNDQSVEVMADWRTYFDRWHHAAAQKIQVIVRPLPDVLKLIANPMRGSACMTLFIAEGGQALVYDQDCVPQDDVYERGTAWMLGQSASIEQMGLHAIQLKTDALDQPL